MHIVGISIKTNQTETKNSIFTKDSFWFDLK